MKEKLKKKDEDPFGSGLNRLVTASLIFPGLFCIVVFLGLPCLSLVLLSFFQKGPYGTIEWTLTLDNFARLLGFNIFGWSPHFFKILGRSFIDGAITTIGCVIISYPLCFHIAARKSALARFVWLTLLMVPFCTNVVIRTYAWQLILDPGVLGRIPAALGLVEPGEALYPSAFAVYLGMISTFLPFMALPLYASVERLNWTLDQAAKDLYSSKRTRFLRTVLPQTVNGLYAGIIITLVPSMAMFVVTD
ncbi:MAG: ABC transporter permease, partial [Deltaproteobacteria bacterium]|nr:ABC transporter permease [Deltaproteobacteria bacterium]